LKSQINSTLPLRKSIWKQLIKAKIKNQSSLLQTLGKDFSKLSKLEAKVRSGDPDNCEAQASRFYWTQLFGKEFKRERFGDYPNNLLNYAYSIIRAMMARSIVSTGLHPSLGVFHKNQYNAFCLADDLMEPFRPISDSLVFTMYSKYPAPSELNREIKSEILKVAYIDCIIDDKTSPLSLAASISCSSLVKCFDGQTKELMCPHLKE
jgi:CRISPR-associated protein Cas1